MRMVRRNHPLRTVQRDRKRTRIHVPCDWMLKQLQEEISSRASITSVEGKLKKSHLVRLSEPISRGSIEADVRKQSTRGFGFDLIHNMLP